MSITLDYRAELHAGGHTYSVSAAIRPSGDDGPEHVEIELVGADTDGRVTGQGTLVLPPDGLAPAARLVHQVLTGLSTLHGGAAGSAPRPANAQAPWTPEDDDDLRERWLSATGRAVTARRELADHFGRSTNSIRSRLLRIRCDPDSPGRMLTDPVAQP